MTIQIDVSRKLGTFELKVSFDVASGFTVLTGPSGSGKTTILNMIGGLLQPDTGCITVNGQALFDKARRINIPIHKRRIGYVFQEARLFPHLSVKHNLSYGRWFSRSATAAALPEVTALLGIGHLLHRKPENLSGGEKQRVAIGRALLTSPQLLLMDEPLSALDRQRREDIIPYLERLHRETGIPVLYTTHNPDEVAHLATAHVELS